MKVGYLVKYKWITMAQKRRAAHFGCSVDSIGMIIDVISESKEKEGRYNQLLVKFVDMPQPVKATQFNLEKVA